MVMAVNPPMQGNTFDAFLAKAKAIGAAEAAKSSGYSPTATSKTMVPPYSSGASSSASASYPAVQTVAVGRDGLTFTPPIVYAKPGQAIDFVLCVLFHFFRSFEPLCLLLFTMQLPKEPYCDRLQL